MTSFRVVRGGRTTGSPYQRTPRRRGGSRRLRPHEQHRRGLRRRASRSVVVRRSSRWRRVGPRVRRPGAHRRRRAVRAAGASRSTPLLTNEHPDILAFWLPAVLVPGSGARRQGTSRCGTRTRCSGYRFAADPQSGWLYLPPMAAVLHALTRRGDAGAHRAEPAARRARPLLVPAQGVALPRRWPRSAGCALGDADVDLGHGDLDAVRGLPRLDHGRAGRRIGLPARRSLVAPAGVARPGARSRGHRWRAPT